MNENEILKGRLKDLADMSYRQNRYTYTNFLSSADMEIFYQNIDQLSYPGYSIFGGRESCERVMIAFGREEYCGCKPDFPISVIKVSAVIDKFSDDLDHRDFLGAIMNLGLQRDMIGDILVSSNDNSGKRSQAYVFCVDTITHYLMDNLIRIKHTNVKCTLCDEKDIDKIQTEKEPVHIIAASSRADAVIAAITGLSRSSTSELFRDKKVSLNNRLYENSSYQLKSGDIFSVKGYGKYEYIEAGPVTRKGRLNITLLKYI